jgi:hypothetical protein
MNKQTLHIYAPVKITIHLILLGFLVSILLSSVYPMLAIVSAEDKNAQANIDGSIIITDKPVLALAKAEYKNLSATFAEAINDTETIIALEEPVESGAVQQLAQEVGGILAPNYVYQSTFVPNDPNYSNQWNLPKISAPAAWDITRGSSDVVIAVIDSGILFEQTINNTTYSQPDFPLSRMWTNPLETGMTQPGDACWTGAPEDKRFNNCDDSGNGLIDDWRGWDFMGGYRGASEVCPNHSSSAVYQSGSDPSFVTQDNDPGPYSCDSPSSPNILNKDHYNGSCEAFVSACYVGHGTMVASVVAAQTNNNQLIAGIDHNAKIMNLRALDGYGFSTTARIAAAVNYAANNGADVINMSLGGNCNNSNFTDSVMEAALLNARNSGVVSVAASGNDGWANICYPASSAYTIAVGATNQSDNRQSYSNYGSKLDVVAPAGVPVANAPSAQINSNYFSNAHGTSLSTPHVAGLAALLRAQDPGASVSTIRGRIINFADKVSGMNGNNYTNQYGYGRINMHSSLIRLKDITSFGSVSGRVQSSILYSNPARTARFTTIITAQPGQKIYGRIRMLNTGTETWQQNWTRLGTVRPIDRKSIFQDDTWSSATRLTSLKESSIAPGQIGTFEFILQAPPRPGTYIERFNAVAEGRSWFSNNPVAYTIDVVRPVGISNTNRIQLQPGQQLLPGQYLLSADRHTTLTLQRNGNVVLRTNLRTIWSSRTSNTNPGRLVMQNDGNLVLYARDGSVLWQTRTRHSNNQGSRLTTQTDGNLVMYRPNNTPVWQTGTPHNPNNLRMVMRIMPRNSVLFAGQSMQTPDRNHRFELQNDGNLVLYSRNRVVWASLTQGRGVRYLSMQNDGNLVLYDVQNRPIWQTRTYGVTNARLVIQQDGNVVMYRPNNTPVWQTGTYRN